MNYTEAFARFRDVYDILEKLESLIAENGECDVEQVAMVIRLVKTTSDILAMAEVTLADHIENGVGA